MTPTSPWFRLPLSAMLPEHPTYFTGSVLGPSAERALRAAYEEFGASLAGGSVVWDPKVRRAALNDSLLRSADETLRRSLGDSGGGLSRLLGGGSGKRTTALISQTLADAPTVIARIERWWTRVRAMEWRQATVLQIMEELEPRAEDALLAQERIALSLAAAMQLQASQIKSAPTSAVTDLSAGIDDRLPATGYADALRSLTASLTGVDTSSAPDDFEQWPAALRGPVDKFLTGYGRWSDQPLETAQPRWVDDPAALLAALPASMTTYDPTATSRRTAAAASLSRQLGGGQRKQFDAASGQVEQLVALLPKVHEAVVIVAAAARYWVSGAAGEALADGRLETADEVFLLELEELKQLMTGEWSNVEQVRPLVEARKQ